MRDIAPTFIDASISPTCAHRFAELGVFVATVCRRGRGRGSWSAVWPASAVRSGPAVLVSISRPAGISVDTARCTSAGLRLQPAPLLRRWLHRFPSLILRRARRVVPALPLPSPRPDGEGNMISGLMRERLILSGTQHVLLPLFRLGQWSWKQSWMRNGRSSLFFKTETMVDAAIEADVYRRDLRTAV
eukprot:4455136-Prymnesium_polylepis.1